ncbi:DUF429 domain-containing protein [Candidatus Marinarcus aquaticus]|uniref:DUF429 domain-containing protein n=1 Tax=Candidatus Marinarcus aquaticus TaxID=2044504 RepID=A0A4Q0XTT4_9BACT|nr:DUF429 domain-containing protein [Candidatus Marinarcus aquaticus]RXJ57573.1 hypothetical protein CRV04_07105 [Candidatus Marinarcus aquaticus]
MRYLGIDLAWSSNNITSLALIEENQLLEVVDLQSTQEIVEYIKEKKPDKIGIDAPLLIENEQGNRQIEKNFLKDFSKYKLGAYPVNRTLFKRLYKEIRGEEIANSIEYTLRENLFEVYPHATIIQLFTKDHVLPYKRKKGRDVQYIKEQLQRYAEYLSLYICNIPDMNIPHAKGKQLKTTEDRLDAICCALTLWYGFKHGHHSYDNLLIVPQKLHI